MGLPEVPPRGFPVARNTTHQFWLNAKFVESPEYLARMRVSTETFG